MFIRAPLGLTIGLLSSGVASAAECPLHRDTFRFDDYGVNYTWHTRPAYTITLNARDHLIFVEDYGENYEGCNSEESLVFQSSLKSFALNFAVPKDYGTKETWVFDGHQFEKAGVVDLRVLGKEERVDRIVSHNGGKKTVYLFSPENGLRGFVIPGGYREVAQAFLSVDAAGPFAMCTDS